ncbi:MAG TPA: hypothetical protein VN950_19220 [Terriglobales bacterium]|nr:hypothetical protein [Terriglobales bacterium]
MAVNQSSTQSQSRQHIPRNRVLISGLPKLTRKGNIVLDRDRAFDIAAGIMAVLAYSENQHYSPEWESGDFNELKVRCARRFASA